MPTDCRAALGRDGYVVVRQAVGAQLLDLLREAFAEPSGGRRGGQRNALDVPAVVEAVRATRHLAEALTGGTVSCVRGIVFDKTPLANWKVAWHQDRSIAVLACEEVPGYGPWSIKADTVHVQPPAEVLSRMITIRLNVDACGDSNGPLRVIPGSHAGGILTDDAIAAWRDRGPEQAATGVAGDAVVMRPLLLHASSPAVSPCRRRVVHLEFSPDALAAPLAWRWHL